MGKCKFECAHDTKLPNIHASFKFVWPWIFHGADPIAIYQRGSLHSKCPVGLERNEYYLHLRRTTEGRQTTLRLRISSTKPLDPNQLCCQCGKWLDNYTEQRSTRIRFFYRRKTYFYFSKIN